MYLHMYIISVYDYLWRIADAILLHAQVEEDTIWFLVLYSGDAISQNDF